MKKTAEKKRVDKKLEETHNELKEVDAVAQWGIKDIREFENKVTKGSAEPKGLMSAESMELKKKRKQINKARERLTETNENFKWRVKCKDKKIDEKLNESMSFWGSQS
mgnify:CR=1 FL=1